MFIHTYMKERLLWGEGGGGGGSNPTPPPPFWVQRWGRGSQCPPLFLSIAQAGDPQKSQRVTPPSPFARGKASHPPPSSFVCGGLPPRGASWQAQWGTRVYS